MIILLLQRGVRCGENKPIFYSVLLRHVKPRVGPVPA
jgi:hypothetical protein